MACFFLKGSASEGHVRKEKWRPKAIDTFLVKDLDTTETSYILSYCISYLLRNKLCNYELQHPIFSSRNMSKDIFFLVTE